MARESIPIVACSIALLLLTVSVRFAVLPLRADISRKAQRLSAYSSLISEKDGYRTLSAEIARKNDLLRARIVEAAGGSDTLDLSGMLKALIDKADMADIRFAKIQPQPETSDGDFTGYPILLETTTTYHALGKFISSFDAPGLLVRVDRLAIDAADVGKLNVKLMVTGLIPAGKKS